MIYSLIIGLLIMGLSFFCWLKPADAFSKSERRMLKQFPQISYETVLNGDFMTAFESYTLDQFPLRDQFRGLKAYVQKYILRQKDNKGVYLAQGYLGQMDEKMSEVALNRSMHKLNSVYETYIKGTDAKVYLSVIPDKNYFLAEKNGYLSYDYEELYSYVKEGFSDAAFIEIRDLLTIEDYYHTDSHWKQECIIDVAERLVGSMRKNAQGSHNSNVTIDVTDYETNTVDTPFYGVYYGQAALAIEPDKLTYLDNAILSQCKVFDHENQREIPIYDLQKAAGRDGYEMFLSGALSVITIENPNAVSEKELVIFRDSFGSSIAPLMVENYAKITLVDIRYINETMIGKFIDFTDQDVLFLYSTSVLNNESSFR